MAGKKSLNRSVESMIRSIALKNPLEAETGNIENIKRVADHITKHFGPPSGIFHETTSEIVQIDIFHIRPSPHRNCNILITSGLSEKAMITPEKARECRFAELMAFLPPSWPVSLEAFRREEHYWPVRWLKMLARMPHSYETWLGSGHTIPNGDPPQPFSPNTKFCGILIVGPPIEYEDFFALKVYPGKTIYFQEMMPIYREEMEFKLKHGVDALIDRFWAYKTSNVIDINRVNVCRRKKR